VDSSQADDLITTDSHTGTDLDHYIRKIDPWSVAKSAFVLGIVIAGVLMVTTIVIWLILSAAGVFDSVTNVFANSDSATKSSGINWVSLARLIGVSMLIGAIEIALLTVFSGLFAMLYNLSVGFTGGIRVSVREER